jgi:glycerol-3-phosphate acyltransferase PlsY
MQEGTSLVVPIPFIVLAVVGFVIGCVPFAYIFVKKMKGIDIRTQGSGNVGATNASRLLGRPMGILIMLLDALKGAAAAWVLPHLLRLWADSPHLPLAEAARVSLDAFHDHPSQHVSLLALVMGLCAFLGHCLNPFLRFKGGKGVATALGVYLVVAPKAVLLTLLVCVAIIVVTRLVSLASITGAILLPVLLVVFYWPERHDGLWPVLAVTAVICLAVVVRHRANIKRLLARTEQKV